MKRSATWRGHGMMPVKICSARAIGSANSFAAWAALRGEELGAFPSSLNDTLAWAHAAERAVVEDYQLAIDQLEARLTELDQRLTETAQAIPIASPWRGCAVSAASTFTAMFILAELHDVRRFASAPALMAYLGLVPGGDSSGEKHQRPSPARGTPWSGACWWKRPGTINIARAPASP